MRSHADTRAKPTATPKKPRRVRTALLAVVIVAGAALGGWRLTWPTFAGPEQELSYRVTELVKHNPQIKNAVLCVLKGDGSFSWSGAAGVARQDGQVPMTADTPIYIASVTKLYTAAAIMRLYEQGALALDDPIAMYLPEDLIRGIHTYQGHDYSHEITIAQLLAHTSGLADYYEDTGPDGKNGVDLFMEDQARAWSPDELIVRARDTMPPHFAPNAQQAYYSDTGYLLLGKIIESITGKPLGQVYAEFFFQPLGLSHTWLSTRSEPAAAPAAAPAEVFSGDTNITQMRGGGSYWADGGIVTTAEEAVLFLKALNQGQIVKPETLALMHQWNAIQNAGSSMFTYGYGTMRFTLPGPISAALGTPVIWGHTGSISAFLYYAPDRDVYVAGTVGQTAGQMQAIVLMMQAFAVLR